MKRIQFAAVLSSLMLAVGCGDVKVEIDSAGDEAVTNNAGVTLASLDDIKAELDKAKGKVAVINFWATWCAPCKKEMPELVEFDNEYKGKGVHFISISYDEPSVADTAVAEYASKMNFPFPVLVKNDFTDEDLKAKLNLNFQGMLPTTIVLDKNGDMAKEWLGAIEIGDLTEVVDPLL